MAFIDGQLYFAPGILMRDLEFDDHDFLLSAFERRTKGLFLTPIRILEQSIDAQEGALFGAALLVAALIESLARVETGSTAQGTLIKQWLETHITQFRDTVVLNSGRSGAAETRSAADVFEHRFRNGLAHNGYVASLGRLSGSLAGPVTIDGDIVIVNPFALADAAEESFDVFANDIRCGRRDIRRFAHYVTQQFRAEVERARADAAL